MSILDLKFVGLYTGISNLGVMITEILLLLVPITVSRIPKGV